MDCPTCAGADETVYEVSTSFTPLEVQEIDNRIILPRPLRPENICFESLHNVNLDPDNPVDLSDTNAPLFWDFTPDANGDIACKIRLGSWPCPVVIEEWDVNAQPEPVAADCGCDAGQVKMYKEVTQGCVTHICVDGVLHCLAGTGGVDEGMPADQVCYDTSTWTFPVSYGGTGSTWDVYGNDIIDAPCGTGPAEFTGSDLQFACWGDFGGSSGPSASNGWNSLNWQPDAGVAPQNVNFPAEVGATETSHGCIRPAFRFDPGFTSGTSGPFEWTINLTDGGGTVRWAAYDTVTGQQIPVTIVSQPPGGTANVETGPHGQLVHAPGSVTGIYKFKFSLPFGVNADDVEFLAWNIGNSGNELEQFTNLEITGVPSVGNCCYELSDVGDLANYMNSTDIGSGSGWIVSGDVVCNTYAAGIGQNYGVIDLCGATASPQITSTTSGGGSGGSGCPNCVEAVDNGDGTGTANQSSLTNVDFVVPCGFTASSGDTATVSGVFFDACEAFDATSAVGDLDAWVNANLPVAGYPLWWRQPVIGPSGGSTFTLVDQGGFAVWVETTN